MPAVEKNMSVKAYLDKGNGKTEARRFCIADSIPVNYALLRLKVLNVFNLRSQDIMITWQGTLLSILNNFRQKKNIQSNICPMHFGLLELKKKVTVIEFLY